MAAGNKGRHKIRKPSIVGRHRQGRAYLRLGSRLRTAVCAFSGSVCFVPSVGIRAGICSRFFSCGSLVAHLRFSNNTVVLVPEGQVQLAAVARTFDSYFSALFATIRIPIALVLVSRRLQGITQD